MEAVARKACTSPMISPSEYLGVGVDVGVGVGVGVGVDVGVGVGEALQAMPKNNPTPRRAIMAPL
jgi:hypothetical protein